jgi:class 3 adenylate cyclase
LKTELSYDDEVLEQIKSGLAVITHNMAIPLYLFFWLCDLIYIPSLKWELLIVRLLVVPFTLFINKLSKKTCSNIYAQWLVIIIGFGLSSSIHYMIFRIGSIPTPYYAGLNLVALGILTFIPLSLGFFILSCLVIYTPYFIFILMRVNSFELAKLPLINSFFIAGTIIISIIIRHFQNRLSLNDFESKIALFNEIQSRDRIIAEKTDEAIKLSQLSMQFSPQIVEAIRAGQIKLSEEAVETEVCCIFIDLVKSTDRIVQTKTAQKVISKFLADSVRILLKYDITIDKFMGDGILAFSNAPVKYDDFVDRVVYAAIEVRDKISASQDFYDPIWLGPLQIRIGIAVGKAEVGFYGEGKVYRVYTALGSAVNLASRLCSSAEIDQISISKNAVEAIISNNFLIEPCEKKQLKGFENFLFEMYQIKGARVAAFPNEINLDCKVCNNGILYLDSGENGIFVFKCRSCGAIDRTT